MEKILVIGANGQLGTELVEALRESYGPDNVIATDIREPETINGPFEALDILNQDAYRSLLKKYDITQVYHLAAMLSAKGEANPPAAWRLNMESLITVLESGRDLVKKIYWPSSIAVFGPGSPKVNTPQSTIMDPTTVYGISKLAGERWCDYYHHKYGVDVRSLRYPGLIGYKALPGGGTTDYAVDVFWKAVEGLGYECFLEKDTRLPMMYMEDAIRGTVELMHATPDQIGIRTSYNFAGMSFTPQELFDTLSSQYPDMRFSYAPDFRQEIATSWPESIDDSEARAHWNWSPKYDIKKLCKAMTDGLKARLVVH